MQRLLPYSLLMSCLGLALAAGSWWMLLPIADQIAEHTAQVRQLDATYDQAGVRKQQLGDRASIAQVSTVVNSLIPTEDLQYDLIIQLEAMAKVSGLQVPTISVIPQASATATAAIGSTNKVAVTVSVNGTYAEVQQFIEQMLGVNRFITIDQVSLTSSGAVLDDPSAAGSGTVTVQIAAIAYFVPGAPAVPSPR